ncbi:MAG: UDP-N-acetylmuramoyl-L-alanine--D-glutamate ligase [Pseudolabrys sp.]|nr:UDP-N-acetylmuramoyl-L-alanine--D-glutamate ligase [Pseudolabrys sp.]
MIPVTIFAGRTVVVFGLGSSGLESAKALAAGGAKVLVADDEPQRVIQAAANGLESADLHALHWSKVAALVLSPGVPLTHPKPHWAAALAREHSVEIIGDVELFSREREIHLPPSPLVAITGTNGKSTTTALTAHLLKSAGIDTQMGGNIGTPVLALEPFAPNRAYVIEVSSYQVDLAPNLRPTVGILLNISEDHLDRHGSMENYAALKTLVPAQIEQGGTAVVAVDDQHTRAAADRLARAGRNVLRISATNVLRDGLYADGSRIMQAANGKAVPIAQLAGIGSLRGAHNAQNAMAAIAAAQALGLTPAQIQKGLTTFPGLAHRMEEIGRKGSVLFVNDSKATNADSAARALSSFNDIFWIAGGKPKSGGITSLAEFFPKIRKAYLIGEAAADFARTLDGKVPYEIAGKLSQAIDLAVRDAEEAPFKEPVILLSPACASFDQYRNFEVRGDAFRELVLALPGLQPMRR